tara:strand:- start:1658 stop:1861 length:204 start_codon:yes stop_codon:yes gene_type:complete
MRYVIYCHRTNSYYDSNGGYNRFTKNIDEAQFFRTEEDADAETGRPNEEVGGIFDGKYLEFIKIKQS